MKLLVVIEISQSNQKKIAYDMGRYADDLPDDVECKDWLEQLIQDEFDSLPEANEITHLVQVIREDGE